MLLPARIDQVQQRGRLERLHTSERRNAGPVCCNFWFGPICVVAVVRSSGKDVHPLRGNAASRTAAGLKFGTEPRTVGNDDVASLLVTHHQTVLSLGEEHRDQ